MGTVSLCGRDVETERRGEAGEGRRTARCYRTGCCSRWTGALRGSRSGGERALHSFPDRRRRRPYTRSAGACGVYARSEARSNRVEGRERTRRVFFIKPSAAARQRRKTYLVAPEEFVPASVLEAIPDVQKLGNSMRPDVIRVLLGLVPGEGCAEVEEAHDSARVASSRAQKAELGERGRCSDRDKRRGYYIAEERQR